MAAVAFNANHFPKNLHSGDRRVGSGAGIALEGDVD